eukprot:158373-Chlamydomonas_euryale.AAC.1
MESPRPCLCLHAHRAELASHLAGGSPCDSTRHAPTQRPSRAASGRTKACAPEGLCARGAGAATHGRPARLPSACPACRRASMQDRPNEQARV